MTETSPSPADKRELALLLLVAFALRLVWVLVTPALPASDFQLYEAAGREIAAGGGIASTYRGAGYPVFLAVVFRLFGDQLLAAQLANVVLGTLTCGLTYLLARSCLDRGQARIACAAIACMPNQVFYTGLLASENLFTPLLVASCCVFFAPNQRVWLRRGGLALSGLLLGLANLVRSVSIFLPAAWFVLLLWKGRSWQRAGAAFAIVATASLLAMSPWLASNYTASGRLLTQANGGANFLMGAHPHSTGAWNPQILDELGRESRERDLDEFASDRLAYRRGLEFVARHPLRWLALIPLKWFHLLANDHSGVYWNFHKTKSATNPVVPLALKFVAQAYYGIFLLLAAIGFFWGRWAQRMTRLDGPLAVILYWLALHALLIGNGRFHLPLMPFVAVFTAVGATAARRWASERRERWSRQT